MKFLKITVIWRQDKRKKSLWYFKRIQLFKNSDFLTAENGKKNKQQISTCKKRSKNGSVSAESGEENKNTKASSKIPKNRERKNKKVQQHLPSIRLKLKFERKWKKKISHWGTKKSSEIAV